MSKLTKRTVEAAKPEGRDWFLWDDDLPGFGCRVFASGKRSYLVQYRAGGRTRRLTIGLHGRLTAEEARKEAKALLGEVAKGGNPADVRAKDREAVTVGELCRRYLEAAEKGLVLGKRKQAKRASTLTLDRGRIERHIKPLLGTRRVIDLTTPDLARFMRDVAQGKTKADIKTKKRGRAIVTGGQGAAARTLGLLGGILTFAVSEGIRPDNPARGVARFADRKRKVVLKPEQYRALGEALEAGEREGENWKAIAAIRLIALTGCRRDEIARLKLTEVDEVGHCFRLADTKEGENLRPIGRPAIDLLRRLPRSKDGQHVLPGDRGDGHYTGLPKAWLRIRGRAETIETLTLHGLRHAFASIANELGYTEATRAALLGHTASKSQTGDYTHHLDNVLVAAADRVAQWVHALMNGQAATVLRLATNKRRRS